MKRKKTKTAGTTATVAEEAKHRFCSDFDLITSKVLKSVDTSKTKKGSLAFYIPPDVCEGVSRDCGVLLESRMILHQKN